MISLSFPNMKGSDLTYCIKCIKIISYINLMPKRLTVDVVEKNIAKYGHKLISDKYINSKVRLEVLCGFCGKEMKQTYDSMMRGYGHGCQGTGLEIMNANKKQRKKMTILYRFICKGCGNIFYKKRKDSIFCTRECFYKYHMKLGTFKISGKKGGLLSTANNRSLNEIYFANLCIAKWGEDNILCNEKVFDGFDADVIIVHLRIAIEWNGIFHYKKVKKNQKLKQKQAKDRVKKSIITKKYGWGLYIIKDMGSYKKKFVEEQFSIFCKTLQTLLSKLPNDYINIAAK